LFIPAKILIETKANEVSVFPTMALADQMKMPVEAFLELAAKDSERLMQTARITTPVDKEESVDIQGSFQRLAMRHPEAITIESYRKATR